MDEPILTYEGTTRTWLTADPQGSIIALADDAGTATAVNGYGPYGEPPLSATGSAITGRFGYTGQAAIEGIGNLYDYRARTYAPWLGRFLQADPIGTDGGMNLYEYADSDPVNGSDPSGLDPNCDQDCIIVTATRRRSSGGNLGSGGASGAGALNAGAAPRSMQAPAILQPYINQLVRRVERDVQLARNDVANLVEDFAEATSETIEGATTIQQGLEDAEGVIFNNNDIRSRKSTTVYELLARSGITLKYGITCKHPIKCRYTNEYFLTRGVAEMAPITTYRSRQAARVREYSLCRAYQIRYGSRPKLSTRC